MDFSSAMSADDAIASLQGGGTGESGQGEGDPSPSSAPIEGGEAGQQTNENVFYDATRVPAELQPSFREMQAAWTKKSQEAADALRWHKSFSESYGDIEEVSGFLDTLRDPDGLYSFVQTLAQELGITPAQAEQAIEQAQEIGNNQNPQGSANSPQNPNDLNRPMTVQEFMQWQQQQEQKEVQRREDVEIDRMLQGLEIPESLKGQEQEFSYHVLAQANRLPAHLGYAERIKRAQASVRSMLDAYASAQSATANETNGSAPAPLGGGMPSGSGDRQDPNKWPAISDLRRDLGT